MERWVKYCFALVVVILIICAGIVYMKGIKTSNTVSHEDELEPIKQNVNGINISIDPRIELLASVQITGNYVLKDRAMTKLDFSYKNDMKNYFSKYSSHKAVQTFEGMNSVNFSYDAPPTAMLYLSNPLKLEQMQDYDDYLIGRAGGKELKNFTSQLQKFAADTKFNEFYKKNNGFYKTVLEKNIKMLENTNYINDIETYYGMKQNSYNIILSPLFHSGGYGPRIKNKNGSYDIYSIQGPVRVENGIPMFGTKESFRYIAWHEFSHSFVNPATEENISKINNYKELYTPIEKYMKPLAYPEWKTCVNEHIVRAVTARLIYTHDGKEAYDNDINYERSQGFFYVEALAKKLEEYENSRNKYKSFKDFYPELIGVFKDLSEKNLGEDFYKVKYSGPINSTLSLEDPSVYIMPTNEKDEKVQKKLQDYVIHISDYLKSKYKYPPTVITDKEALEQDMSNKNIHVYGTIDGNLWLKKYCGSLPFKVEKDKIVADKSYIGSNLRLITGIPSPVNSNNAMIIYTAQKAKDILNINSIFHGPTDYVISDGKTVLNSGNYIKENGKWSFR